ncbi:coiled-coil domain-containing protein 125 [Xyrichtys novacula]|uniref:Coiled-coil domain-containing protein 125 n=1 Tax=Xyrichtys novacula TaxID=13765 RepID=A0AAV1G8I3_XYRNO|nr:coiled-coil domain-containing protein 125 [Xyrichtys novacula]
MQAVGGACDLDDDMLDGDLGDGMGGRAAHKPGRMKSQSFSGVSETPLIGADRLRRSLQTGEPTLIPGLKTKETLQKARWKLQLSGSLMELSKDELRDRLQEATEVIDALCCELEVSHRYFEGKYKALKILQGKAILDRATCHTQSVLQKSEEKAKALEKEVNSLQWELSFNQVQMRKCQQSWEHNYSRVVSENQTLTDTLEEREHEIQQLRAENSALSRQCLELLSMLNVKEQRVYQETKPMYSPDRDAGILELAVLGACRCAGVADVCPCSRAAAASRKQLIQLQQELDAQRSRREEAMMQQLRKRSEHFLLLAEANILKSHHSKSEGANKSPRMKVSQRLKGLLPSGLEVKMSDDLLETLYKLLDLLNDKEEALAHQRKVSLMLAHNAEELQRQLHLDSHCQPAEARDLSESKITSKPRSPVQQPALTNTRSLSHHKNHQSKTQPLDVSDSTILSKPAPGPFGHENQSRTPEPRNQQEVPPVSNILALKNSLELPGKPELQLQPGQPLCCSETRSKQNSVQLFPNHKNHKFAIQQSNLLEFRVPSKQPKEVFENQSQTDTPEPETQATSKSNILAHKKNLQDSQLQSGQLPSVSECRTQPECHSLHEIIQQISNHKDHMSDIQLSNQLESNMPSRQPHGPLGNPSGKPESDIQPRYNQENHTTKTQGLNQSEPMILSKQSERPSGIQSQSVPPESKTRISSKYIICGQQQLELPVSQPHQEKPCPLESRTEKQDLSDPPKINIQPVLNHKKLDLENHPASQSELRIPLRLSLGQLKKPDILGSGLSMSKKLLKQSHVPIRTQRQCQQTLDQSESKTHPQNTTKSLKRVQHPTTTTSRAARVQASAKTTTKSVRVQD